MLLLLWLANVYNNNGAVVLSSIRNSARSFLASVIISIFIPFQFCMKSQSRKRNPRKRLGMSTVKFSLILSPSSFSEKIIGSGIQNRVCKYQLQLFIFITQTDIYLCTADIFMQMLSPILYLVMIIYKRRNGMTFLLA